MYLSFSHNKNIYNSFITTQVGMSHRKIFRKGVYAYIQIKKYGIPTQSSVCILVSPQHHNAERHRMSILSGEYDLLNNTLLYFYMYVFVCNLQNP